MATFSDAVRALPDDALVALLRARPDLALEDLIRAALR